MTTWVSLELIMISKRSRHIKTSTEKSHSCRKHSEGDLEDSMHVAILCHSSQNGRHQEKTYKDA